jgi:CRP/FNR family cyclic AMP-dependent transcriptional regulator
VTFSTGWPIQKQTRDAGTRGGAQEAKLALTRRMDALASVPLFACLSKRQLQTLARACSSHRWPPDSMIVAEGSSDQYCYVVVEGTVGVERGGRRIAELGPGEIVGEIALFDAGPRSATVTTETEVVAVGLPRKRFVEVAVSDPHVALRMLELMARRVRETTEKLAY